MRKTTRSSKVKGTYVVDEVVCRIVDMYFEKGKLWLVAKAESPPDHSAGVTDIRLYGRDGTECGTVRTFSPEWKDVTGTLTVIQDVIFTEMTGEDKKGKRLELR